MGKLVQLELVQHMAVLLTFQCWYHMHFDHGHWKGCDGQKMKKCMVWLSLCSLNYLQVKISRYPELFLILIAYLKKQKGS